MPLQWRHLRFTVQRRWSPKEDGRYYSTSFCDSSIPPRGVLDFDLLDGGELVGGDVVYLNQDVPRAGGERGRDAPPLQQFVHPIDNDINRQQHVARVSMLVDFLTHPLDGLRGRAEVQIPLACPEKLVTHLSELVAKEGQRRAFRLGGSDADAPSSNRTCGFPAYGFPCETGIIGFVPLRLSA